MPLPESRRKLTCTSRDNGPSSSTKAETLSLHILYGLEKEKEKRKKMRKKVRLIKTHLPF